MAGSGWVSGANETVNSAESFDDFNFNPFSSWKCHKEIVQLFRTWNHSHNSRININEYNCRLCRIAKIYFPHIIHLQLSTAQIGVHNRLDCSSISASEQLFCLIKIINGHVVVLFIDFLVDWNGHWTQNIRDFKSWARWTLAFVAEHFTGLQTVDISKEKPEQISI